MGLLTQAVAGRGCVDRETLVQFDQGLLSAEDLDLVATHLSSCEWCERLLLELMDQPHSDELVKLLKVCLEGPAVPQDPAFASMVAMAEKIPLNTTAPGDAPQHGGGHELGVTLRRSVGQYELCGKIGRGGMGIVYRARQVSLDRIVALKMILAGSHAGEKAVARFAREGRAIARLRHPNVVRIYDFGESDGLSYYTMELVEGGSLQQKLVKGPLPLVEAATLVQTLALAVEAAHQEGIIHRDLKPGNILLDKDGTPKISDFGLAKFVEDSSDGPTPMVLTDPDAVIGTPRYMAPEQIEGRAAAIDRSTDVYALGTILYESLTGRPPFVAKTNAKTLELILSTEPKRPSHRRKEVPYWLEAICLKCLEKSPARRYPSAQALADDLACWIANERPRGIPNRLTRLGRRLRRHTGIFILGLTPAVVGTVHFFNSPDRILTKMESDLAHGRMVTLIGRTGNPRWLRWEHGRSKCQSELEADGTFTVQSWTLGLIELLPHINASNYRIIAEVRQNRGEEPGQVGMYFGHQVLATKPLPLHFFTELSFNAIRSYERFLGQAHASVSKSYIPDDSAYKGGAVGKLKPSLVYTPDHYSEVRVRLSARIFCDEIRFPSLDHRLVLSPSPTLKPSRNNINKWYRLEVIITPSGITHIWDGKIFSCTANEFQTRIFRNRNFSSPHPGFPVEPALVPVFDSHAGLGLYVKNGSASFRNVSVTSF